MQVAPARELFAHLPAVYGMLAWFSIGAFSDESEPFLLMPLLNHQVLLILVEVVVVGENIFWGNLDWGQVKVLWLIFLSSVSTPCRVLYGTHVPPLRCARTEPT